jgi:hypothetical protein
MRLIDVAGKDDETPAGGDDSLGLRFEATVHAADARDLDGVADLDLDRVPDPDGGVRVLVDLTGCARLVRAGFEVRLLRALPRRGIDPALVMDDDSARGWLDDRVRATGRAVPGPEGDG